MPKPIKLRPKVPKEKIPYDGSRKWNVFEIYNLKERKALKNKVIDLYSNQLYSRKDIARLLNVPRIYVQSIVKDLPSHQSLGIVSNKLDNIKIVKPKIISEKKQKAKLVDEINQLLLDKSILELKEIVADIKLLYRKG